MSEHVEPHAAPAYAAMAANVPPTSTAATPAASPTPMAHVVCSLQKPKSAFKTAAVLDLGMESCSVRDIWYNIYVYYTRQAAQERATCCCLGCFKGLLTLLLRFRRRWKRQAFVPLKPALLCVCLHRCYFEWSGPEYHGSSYDDMSKCY